MQNCRMELFSNKNPRCGQGPNAHTDLRQKCVTHFYFFIISKVSPSRAIKKCTKPPLMFIFSIVRAGKQLEYSIKCFFLIFAYHDSVVHGIKTVIWEERWNMRFSERFSKPIKRNLLKIRLSSLNKQASTKRQASIKLVKRYFRLIR